MTQERTFPFSAVVGQEQAKLALTLCAVDPRIGGVLLYGDKGSAKSTLARGLAALIGPGSPFVELPISATEDRVVGTLDVAAALQEGELRFSEGLLAKAHGGVLYVDEVNLLPDHLVDLLLDAAASGVNRIEREGISHEHPTRFVLVGSMNPEEGELRPQLLDRFAFGVDISSSLPVSQRVEAIMTRLAFESGDEARLQGAFESDRLLAGQIAATRPLAMSEHVAQMAAAMATAAGAQGLRADLALCRGAAALAGLRSDGEITKEHLLGVAPLVFAHRRLHPPEDAGGKSLEERIEEGLRSLEAEQPRSDGSSGQADPSPHDAHAGSEPPEQGSPPEDVASGGPGPGDGDSGADPGMNRPFGSYAEEVALFRLAPLSDAKSAGAVASRAGRDRGVVEGRGRVIGDRAFGESGGEIAVAATLRTAALRRARSAGAGAGAGAGALVVEEDLRASRRRDRAGRLVVIAVDASKSMRTAQRIAETKAAVLSLLIDAYQRRDKVALVTFGGAGARLVLRPTSSPEVAKARLEEVETGGLTPLGPGLRTAREVARPGSAPLVVVITDGRATAAAGDGASPWEEALTEARALRDEPIEVVVIDVEEEKGAMGLALRLAQEMGAGYRRMAELSAGTLERSVRELLG